ncbi:hypothetical protein QAD02_003578 [Eretmocerus hayati]|uniref:Uncharacterized protein n=1 Tax=Eretmocerus hayati TaxID=131215 RepID=A0ACC2NPS1_9HYME|nr:hypothetical protein QAD02_003578 [Eretmocerus hayati]
MSRVRCRAHPDRFCYVCGELTFQNETRQMSPSFISLYHAYFKIDVGNSEKSYAPSGVCNTCYMTLRLWSKGERKGLPFGKPMIWSKPKNHPEDCYFCQSPVDGFNRKNRKHIVYPELTSSERPKLHSPDLPLPPAPWNSSNDSREDRDSGIDMFDVSDLVESVDEKSRGPTFFDQKRLNDTVRDLGLTKEQAQLLGSRLQEMGLLLPGTTFSQYRHREKEFTPFFATKDSLRDAIDIIYKRKSRKRSFQAMTEESSYLDGVLPGRASDT